ncbi:MAG TPA: hypothetical protein VLK58_12335 [Conexibacter sp.]|nr:hypothetical protein [Conexibacter sp.]
MSGEPHVRGAAPPSQEPPAGGAAELHIHTAGEGPALLLIAGAGGDA